MAVTQIRLTDEGFNKTQSGFKSSIKSRQMKICQTQLLRDITKSFFI